MLKRLSILTLAIAVTFTWVNPSFGQNMIYKLGRGLANIATSPLEIPVQMMKETRESGDINGLFIGGGKGLLYMFGRMFTGLYEVLTFPIPLPKDYRPIFKPEFVIEGDLLAF